MSDRSEQGESSTARLYRAALGEASAGYYLPLFARFDTQGTAGPVWNGAAALLQPGWLLHHRLWMPLAGYAALAAALALAVAGLWHFAPGWPTGVKLGGSISMLLCLGLVPGLWGSAWLHARVRQRVIKAVKFASTVDVACESLMAEARDRQRRNTWGLAGLLSAVALAVLLWKTVPWPSLLGRADPSVAVSAVASSADRLADPLPAAPAVTSAGSEISMVEAASFRAPATDEVIEATAAVEGPSAAASGSVPAVSAEGTAGTAALQHMENGVQKGIAQTRLVGERPAIQAQPPKPAEASVRAVPLPVERAVSPIAKPPEPKVKSREVPTAALADTVDPAGAAQAADVVKPVVPVAPTGDFTGIRRRVQGFGVAVGMFAVTANAERVVATLSGAGLPVISDSVASSRGELTRVRVGPFERQDQAEKAAAQVKALGLEAKIYAP
ncbi:hypothetical protein LPB72_04545 [Hydrogenophaga crassostreae]|uniref:SPOR domain-containing protein n=1 Tax=Hydrogenophaga crassostreae TaxID=1763535 RepID=A0A162T3H0_9BURK|nr:SPOR domain-containing protein [Hydrogenophaga crassostreae]AOW14762.1 hypothetical protein LPB072_20005 [Hydrogenophaga crassostreae]OAD43142.1 hypothetical protein LPB72_04545 [Hydrogenophaga crassostreae]